MSDEPTLRSLFDAVADLPPAAQEAAVRARTGDNDLIEKVLRLCRHASTDQTHFASAISANAMGFALTNGDTVAVGDTLGAWKITQKIGEGGMGSVFLAARSDGHFQQNVAIKVIHGLPTAAAKARLAQERQILAGLTHPNIARLFDGGATPNGQPYLVMEHVEGVTIDAWCATAGGGFRAVLALLLPICDAVHVAHQRLIVHCDIKPANILVTTAGRPVLLDFGIASLLGDTAVNDIPGDGAVARDDTQITRSIVGNGIAVACTPRYASPEQKAGGVITTASDIYSLGRVLGELCEADPIFAAADASHLAVGTTRLKAREVRAIIAKACNERPEARYGSAMALAADMKRVLDGSAVNAASAIAGYSTRKWLGKYAIALAAAAGFSLQLLTEIERAEQQAIAALAERDKADAANKLATAARLAAEESQQQLKVATVESERQRDSAVTAHKLADAASVRAEASRQEAVTERTAAVSAQTATKKINDFLVSIFQGVNPARGGKRDASALELITEAEKKLGDLKGVDADQQARLFHALGSLHGVIGQTEKSVGYYERELKALEGYGDKTLAQRVELLASISVRRRNASMPGAMAAARESVRLASLIQRTDPRSFVLANNGLMVSLNAEGRYVEAHRIGRLTDDSWHANFPDPWADAGYLTFRSNWAFGHYRMGDYVLAEREFKRVLDLRLARPTSIEREFAQTMASLALTVYELGRASEAIAMLRQSLARTQSALGEASATHRLALGHLASLLRKTERFAECEAVLKTIDESHQKYGEDGDERVGQLIARGNLAAAQGKIAEAINLQGRAFAVYSKSLGETSFAAVSQLATLVELYLRMDDVANARETAEKSIALRKRVYSKFDEPLLNAQRSLAAVETAAGEHRKAAQILQEVVDNYAATSPGLQRRAQLAAARAWQQLAALPPGDTPTDRAASPAKRAIAHAKLALDMAKKTTGENSGTYRTSKALLAKLEATTRGRGGKLIAVLGEPEE